MTTDHERFVICQKCSLHIDTKNVAHAKRKGKYFHNDCLLEGFQLAGGKGFGYKYIPNVDYFVMPDILTTSTTESDHDKRNEN